MKKFELSGKMIFEAVNIDDAFLKLSAHFKELYFGEEGMELLPESNIEVYERIFKIDHGYVGGKRYKPKPDTIPINSNSIKKYLDKSIRFWRKELKNSKTRENKLMAKHYIDAFQSVRVSLFGDLLQNEEK